VVGGGGFCGVGRGGGGVLGLWGVCGGGGGGGGVGGCGVGFGGCLGVVALWGWGVGWGVWGGGGVWGGLFSLYERYTRDVIFRRGGREEGKSERSWVVKGNGGETTRKEFEKGHRWPIHS